MSVSGYSAPGSSVYNSDTLHVGDGTWDSSRDTFLLPNLMPLNLATTRYNGMGNRFRDDPRYYKLVAAHAALATFTFLGLVPIAIFLVRFGNHRIRQGDRRPPPAIRYHIWMQILTFVFATIVLVLGCTAVGSARKLTNPHHAIGVALYVLVVIQVFGGALVHRMKRKLSYQEWQMASLRKMLHFWIGRSTAILGLAQIPLGLALYGSPVYFFVLYALVMAAYVIAYFILSYKATNRAAARVRDGRDPRDWHDPHMSNGPPPVEQEKKSSKWGCWSGLMAVIAAYIGYKWLRRQRKDTETESSDATGTSDSNPRRRTTPSSPTWTTSSAVSHGGDRTRRSDSRASRSGRGRHRDDYDRRSRSRSYSSSRSTSPSSPRRTRNLSPENSSRRHSGAGRAAMGAVAGAGAAMGIRHLLKRDRSAPRDQQRSLPLDRNGHPVSDNYRNHQTTTDLGRTVGYVDGSAVTDIRRAEEGRREFKDYDNTPGSNPFSPRSPYRSGSRPPRDSDPNSGGGGGAAAAATGGGIFGGFMNLFRGKQDPPKERRRASAEYNEKSGGGGNQPVPPAHRRYSHMSDRGGPARSRPNSTYRPGDRSPGNRDSGGGGGYNGPLPDTRSGYPLSMPTPRAPDYHGNSDIYGSTPALPRSPLKSGPRQDPNIRIDVGGGSGSGLHGDSGRSGPSGYDRPPTSTSRRSSGQHKSPDGILSEDDLSETRPSQQPTSSYRRYGDQRPRSTSGRPGSRARHPPPPTGNRNLPADASHNFHNVSDVTDRPDSEFSNIPVPTGQQSQEPTPPQPPVHRTRSRSPPVERIISMPALPPQPPGPPLQHVIAARTGNFVAPALSDQDRNRSSRSNRNSVHLNPPPNPQRQQHQSRRQQQQSESDADSEVTSRASPVRPPNPNNSGGTSGTNPSSNLRDPYSTPVGPNRTRPTAPNVRVTKPGDPADPYARSQAMTVESSGIFSPGSSAMPGDGFQTDTTGYVSARENRRAQRQQLGSGQGQPYGAPSRPGGPTHSEVD